jgi:hypothetical protein
MTRVERRALSRIPVVLSSIFQVRVHSMDHASNARHGDDLNDQQATVLET